MSSTPKSSLTRSILAHYRDSPANYTETHGNNAAIHDEIGRLIDEGFIEERDDTDRASGIVITPAGIALLGDGE